MPGQAPVRRLWSSAHPRISSTVRGGERIGGVRFFGMPSMTRDRRAKGKGKTAAGFATGAVFSLCRIAHLLTLRQWLRNIRVTSGQKGTCARMRKNKQPTFFRQTVSIPMDLKRRMDRAAEPVNWSAEAAKAFEAKLAEIASRKEMKDMSDVVQRLRASKATMENEDFQEGYAAGKVWAEQDADARDLTNLDAFRTRVGNDWEACFVGSDSYSPAAHLADTITGEDLDRGDITEFWERALGAADAQKSYHGEFLRGFAEGALAVWDEVEGQL
jgi:hypothetical protein